MQEWAEVHRLFHREKCSKAEIGDRLGMSRTTVYRLLALTEPPTYERGHRPSLLDPHRARIAELLFDDPEAPATVIIDHLRREGYSGGITILKDHLQRVRPEFLIAQGRQRTSYLPGEIGQGDWWQLPLENPRRQEPHPAALRLRHHASALRCPRGRVQLPQDDAGLPRGLRRLPESSRRRSRQARLGQRLLYRGAPPTPHRCAPAR